MTDGSEAFEMLIKKNQRPCHTPRRAVGVMVIIVGDDLSSA